jgi:hypothetical protein
MDSTYLAAFYDGINNEIRRLRDEQWRLSYYFVVEGMGVIYLFSDSKMERFLNIYVLLLAVALQVGCVVVYLLHLHTNHRYIGRARVVRRRLEHFFGLHDLKLPSGEQVVPLEWKSLTLSKWFEYDTVVAPLMLFVLSVQGGSLYVIVSRILVLTKC